MSLNPPGEDLTSGSRLKEVLLNPSCLLVCSKIFACIKGLFLQRNKPFIQAKI